MAWDILIDVNPWRLDFWFLGIQDRPALRALERERNIFDHLGRILCNCYYVELSFLISVHSIRVNFINDSEAVAHEQVFGRLEAARHIS
jgi:hypothetical protein